tara:strand:- start:4868 stop:6706 length:1839 start_codon:yes stop_codon:yes gene_type:complete
MFKKSSIFHSYIFLSITFLCGYIFSQDALDEEFLASLPDGVAEQIRSQNEKSDNELELEKLFRADTSVESNKKVLELLKDQLEDLEKKIKSEDANKNDRGLERFGSNFFSSIQSSFMPVNVPNLGSDYILDVGDSLKVLLTGTIEAEHEVFIERNGSLLIPEVGSVQIAGKSYQDAVKEVQAFISNQIIGVDTYISLSKLRDIQVVILGMVKNPGVYTISGGSNPLYAINAAGGINESGSYRNIEHKRNGKILNRIDLYQIFAFGNYDFSSQLRSGDIIFINPRLFDIPLTGGINNPAIYELLPNETVTNLINYAGGFSESFYGYDFLTVERRDVDGSNSLSVPLSEFNSFKLRQRDSVVVPYYTNVNEQVLSVKISGMVNRPGTYDFKQGDKLSELINRAGGYRSGAYIFGGMLMREDALDKQRLYAEIVYSDTINFLVSNLAKPNISVDSSSASLLIDELRSQNLSGRIITEFDLDVLNDEPGKDLLIQDGDEVIIPPLQKVVYLFGDFNRPTILQYDSSYSVSDYIKLAGGTKDSATREILLISPNGETTEVRRSLNIFASEKSDIYPGSIIYVPRDIGQISGITYASAVAPVLSSLAISLASLNSISD